MLYIANFINLFYYKLSQYDSVIEKYIWEYKNGEKQTF